MLNKDKLGQNEINIRDANTNFIEKANLMNDWFMTAFFQDSIPETEEVLRIILDNDNLKVTKVETQRYIQGLGHSLRLDVHATDEMGGQHDIEIQKAAAGARTLRARYHSSMMDSASLGKNEAFDKLPETYVIFITETDVLGGGRQIYHIDRYISEMEKYFDDKAHIVYVNISAGDDSTRLGRLMQDFKATKASEMNNEILKKRMHMLKETEERKMELYEMYLEQEVNKATKIAEKRGKKLYVMRMLSKGMTVEEISNLIDEPVEEIRSIIVSEEE